MEKKRGDDPQVEEDDDLLSDAKDTKGFEDEEFHAGEVETEPHSTDHTTEHEGHQTSLLVFEAAVGKSREQEVGEEAEDRDWDAKKLRINALVHDFTIPFFTEITDCRCGWSEMQIGQIQSDEDGHQVEDQ